MTLGISGSNQADELARLSDMTAGVAAIAPDEYKQRIARVQSLMRAQGLAALYLHAGTNL